MEEVKQYFASKGLEAKDIPKGVLLHEVLGLGVLLSVWGGCYLMKPSGRFLQTLQKTQPQLWKKAETRMETSKLLSKIRSSKFVSSSQGTRLVVAFGEGYFIRKLLVPVLVPLKLWVAVVAVIALKTTTSSSTAATTTTTT